MEPDNGTAGHLNVVYFELYLDNGTPDDKSDDVLVGYMESVVKNHEQFSPTVTYYDVSGNQVETAIEYDYYFIVATASTHQVVDYGNGLKTIAPVPGRTIKHGQPKLTIPEFSDKREHFRNKFNSDPESGRVSYAEHFYVVGSGFRNGYLQSYLNGLNEVTDSPVHTFNTYMEFQWGWTRILGAEPAQLETWDWSKDLLADSELYPRAWTKPVVGVSFGIATGTAAPKVVNTAKKVIQPIQKTATNKLNSFANKYKLTVKK